MKTFPNENWALAHATLPQLRRLRAALTDFINASREIRGNPDLGRRGTLVGDTLDLVEGTIGMGEDYAAAQERP